MADWRRCWPPGQVYLLAGALGCAVTAVLAARLRHAWARRANISFVAEQSRDRTRAPVLAAPEPAVPEPAVPEPVTGQRPAGTR